jgi:glutamyl-tRNA synthetase
MIAWLLCRRENGKLLLRIEDLETPRIKGWAAQQAIDDLQWLGIDWEATLGSFDESQPALIQSQRISRYAEILRTLIEREAVYPCTCTRSEIESIAAAPHEASIDGPVYPGTCASKRAADGEVYLQQGIPFAWRFRMPSHRLQFTDSFLGEQSMAAPNKMLGDFVIGRMNGGFAYQLAVVVDDHDTDVNQVVRGDDLVLSTYRQLAIYQLLEWSPPTFCHLPLLIGPDGRRLAKRHGDTRLATLREAGVQAETVVGYLAFQSGMQEAFAPIKLPELLKQDPLERLPKSACIFDSKNAVDTLLRLQRSSLDL